MVPETFLTGNSSQTALSTVLMSVSNTNSGCMAIF